MTYTNAVLIQRLMANALTSATPDTFDALGDLLNIGSTLDTNLIQSSTLLSYIQDAEQTINAALSEIYVTPIHRVVDLEMTLLDVLTVASPNSAVTVDGDYSSLLTGDNLVFTDGAVTEEKTVVSVSGNTVNFGVVFSHVFDPSVTRIIRVDFPAAIKYAATRLATANIFDKYFAAQTDKNESQYGKFFREQATNQLNNILSGVTILHGQHRIGTLTADPTLFKRYGPPKGWNEFPKIDIPGRGG